MRTPQTDKPAALPRLVLRRTAGWRAVDLREVWRARDLLWTFAVRDVKLRYRQTVLGVVWVVFQPLIAALVFAFVFGRVANLPSEGVPYIVFAYGGMLGWLVFQGIVNRASNILVLNAPMMSKIYFPRLVLPASTILSAILDFFVGLTVMIVLLVTAYRAPGLSVLSLPLWLVLVVMLALGVGLFSSALMVRYRDIREILPIALQMLLYLSPVAYSVTAIPASVRTVFSFNPLVGIVEGFRWALIPGTELRPAIAAYSALVAMGVLVLGAFTFARMESTFADVI